VDNELEFVTHEFCNSLEEKLLEKIFKINQKNIPEVGNLYSLKSFKNLLSMSYKNFYVTEANKIVAFAVCFKEGSAYDSRNYEFFSKKEKSFIYIDRIAIEKDYRRNKIGKNLYSRIQSIAFQKKSSLCCEVNTFPINKPSINFHLDLGFIEVGRQDFEENSVAYFKKEI
tara:strand:- start:779 stop:1288 length:510 start_codon:yes stop_codon:yes gene_type:complete